MSINPASELTHAFVPNLRVDVHPIVPDLRVDAHPFSNLRADVDHNLFPTTELRISSFTPIAVLRPKYFNPQQSLLVIIVVPNPRVDGQLSTLKFPHLSSQRSHLSPFLPNGIFFLVLAIEF